MKTERIREILASIRNVRIACLGDFCLDAYWIMDPRGSEISEETGLHAQAVARQYYTLGGASNIVANLVALEPAGIQAIGVIGNDIFGRELRRQLEALNVDTGTLVVQKANFDTVTFGKRYVKDDEEPRIDFGFFNRRSRSTDKTLVDALRKALGSVDAVILNQQVPGSITNDSFPDEVNRLLDEFDDKIVLLDSRHYGDRFRNVCRRANAREAARLVGIDPGRVDVIGLVQVEDYARKLFEQSGKPVFVTRGECGSVVCDSSGLHEVMGIGMLGRVDPVGAGDTTVSALACSLAAGVPPTEAAEFANLAAGVTVKKIFQTGTASPEEIMVIGTDPDYIHRPELAADAGQARYLDDTDIELCCEPADIPLGRVRHVVFDHDGTISTLRQGWEEIMQPMMMQAILGENVTAADEKLRRNVGERVIDYIDRSTGYQTIIQMEALLDMVREFGVVPADHIRTARQYKDIYNKAVRAMAGERLDRLHRPEVTTETYMLTGALEFLKELQRRGVKLYLASGTDADDTLAEAEALGYAGMFDGGVFGALGDISQFSKKMLIGRIMDENGLEGPELAVFGDGPVEIREARRRGGLAVGIAGDEVRRHGLNPAKRTRLIRAGAHVIASDFSQGSLLLGLMFAK